MKTPSKLMRDLSVLRARRQAAFYRWLNESSKLRNEYQAISDQIAAAERELLEMESDRALRRQLAGAEFPVPVQFKEDCQTAHENAQ